MLMINFLEEIMSYWRITVDQIIFENCTLKEIQRQFISTINISGVIPYVYGKFSIEGIEHESEEQSIPKEEEEVSGIEDEAIAQNIQQ